MRLELTVTLDRDTQAQLDRLEAQLEKVLQKENKIMANVDDLIAAVAAEKTVDDSVVALLDQLSTLLKEALQAQDPGKIQQALDAINANKQELVDAISANTPATPVPSPTPEPTA